MRFLIAALFALIFFGGCAATNYAPISCIDKTRLEQREIAAIKSAVSSLEAFKGEYGQTSAYIGFLNGYAADYSKYISAAGSASAVLNYMPIPYAGQISSAANFGAKITALSAKASKSSSTLFASIKELETRVAAYERDKDPAKLSFAYEFAVGALQKDINEAKEDMVKLKEGAAALLAVSKYYKEASDTLSKVALTFSKNETDKRAQNEKTLASKNESFDKRADKVLNGFEEAKDSLRYATAIEKLKREL